MAHIQITLQANKPKRQTFGVAQFLTIADLGAAAGVDVDLEVANIARESFRNLRTRDRLQVVGGRFSSAMFTAAVDCTIEVIASMVDVRLNNQDGHAVDATIVGPNPLPVVTSRGNAAGSPLYVSGQVLGDTPCNNVTDDAGVACGPVEAAILAADATRLEVVILNQGPDPVALGMPGITWAKRAIVLQAGDCWIEARAAAKAWSAITDAGKAATVTMQERKS